MEVYDNWNPEKDIDKPFDTPKIIPHQLRIRQMFYDEIKKRLCLAFDIKRVTGGGIYDSIASTLAEGAEKVYNRLEQYRAATMTRCKGCYLRVGLGDKYCKHCGKRI